MLKPRKKLTQKQIKKDKLVTTYFETVDWFSKSENRKKVYGVLSSLILIALAVFIYLSNKSAKSETAEAKLSPVISLYEDEKYSEAINGDPNAGIMGLIDIVNNYGNTESGETAKYYLANCYFNLGDFDNALKYFEDYSGNNDLLKASCISGIGAVYEAKGDVRKAAEYFEKSTKINKYIIINQENLYNAIRAYSQAGDNEKAKRLFEVLKKEYPNSKYISESKRFETEFQK